MPCHNGTQERSSSKRKEMWKTVQVKNKVERPLQLILDMKVRWSSTYMMLHRATSRKTVCPSISSMTSPSHHPPQCINEFINELRWEEKESAKRDKIQELKLTPEEWDRVKLFQGLLAVGSFPAAIRTRSFRLHTRLCPSTPTTPSNPSPLRGLVLFTWPFQHLKHCIGLGQAALNASLTGDLRQLWRQQPPRSTSTIRRPQNHLFTLLQWVCELMYCTGLTLMISSS
jgi:hypothetical protein